jgi:hypothetical protein
MTLVINKRNASITTWTDVMHVSIVYLLLHRENSVIVSIHMFVKYTTPIVCFSIVKQDKHWNFVHICDDRKQMGSIHLIPKWHIFQIIGTRIPNPHHYLCCNMSLTSCSWVLWSTPEMSTNPPWILKCTITTVMS